jgi:septum formation protein
MLTLASTSTIRRHLLTQAGIRFEAIGSGVDEDAVKEAMRAEGASPRNQADKLAELKALKVSQRRPGFVLGCDQILSFEGLSQLRGKTHTLECAAVIAKEGQPVWRLVTSPKLTMRAFSDDFLRSYLTSYGQEALASVGCYQFEGPGAQLFEKVEGDFFSILGLPLLEVLAFLRLHGEVPT